jgi:hypothetical protein
MDLDRLRRAAAKLDETVRTAQEQGYENADCVLTAYSLMKF